VNKPVLRRLQPCFHGKTPQHDLTVTFQSDTTETGNVDAFPSKTTHPNPPEKRRNFRKQAQTIEKKEAHFEACTTLSAILRRTSVKKYTSRSSSAAHDFL